MNTQTGTSLTGDFEESTWTFEMPKGFEVWAGKFEILPKSEYDTLKASNQELIEVLEHVKRDVEWNEPSVTLNWIKKALKNAKEL